MGEEATAGGGTSDKRGRWASGKDDLFIVWRNGLGLALGRLSSFAAPCGAVTHSIARYLPPLLDCAR
jgi:hypothetical protein